MQEKKGKQAAADADKGLWSRLRTTKALGVGLALVFVFSLGVGVGDGRVPFFFDTNPSKVLPNQLDYSSVESVYDSLRKNYDGKLDEGKLLDGLKQGLATASGDPYTQYLNAADAKKFEDDLNSKFSGIGAELGKDEDNNIVVMAPISGTPAARAGIKSKDVIATINKESTVGMSLDQAISKIRGPKGTKVTLQLIRNREQPIELTITRDDITVPSVESKVLDGNIGYIKINTFSEASSRQVTDAARQMQDASVRAVVLDLRGNPGGLVESAVRVSSLWLPKGKIVMQEKRGNVVVDTYTANGGAIFGETPTAVLLDGGSASASEIVAGALRDHKLAKIVGEKSYGKGSVQQVINLKDGSELKVTVARWYRPNGQNIDKKGIDPDQTVKPGADDTPDGKDTQLEAALAGLRQ